jgi:hypothetical protein
VEQRWIEKWDVNSPRRPQAAEMAVVLKIANQIMC